MQVWLARLMTVVFLFNVLSPAYAEEISSRRPLSPKMSPSQTQRQADIAHGVVKSFEKSRQKYLDDIAPDRDFAHNEFLNAVTFEEMEKAYKKLDELRRNGSKKLDGYRSEIDRAAYDAILADAGVAFEYYRQNPHVAPDAVSQTLGYDARFGSDSDNWPAWANMYSRRFGKDGCPSSYSFLEHLKNNQFEAPEELLEYIDPLGFNCDDYLAVAYAAETLYYMLDPFTEPDSVPEAQREELTVFFSHARYRAVASLARLNGKNASNETLYMARGTLRILLAMLQKAADKNQLQLAEKKLYVVSPTKTLWQKKYPQQPKKSPVAENKRFVQASSNPSYTMFAQSNAYVFETVPPAMEEAVAKGNAQVQEVTYSTVNKNPLMVQYYMRHNSVSAQNNAPLPEGALKNPYSVLRTGMAGDLSKEFYNELESLKNKASDQESKEFTLLQLSAQYAAQFAVLTENQKFLEELLALFEAKPDSDMKTKYSEVLASVFNGIYETLHGFNVRDSYLMVISFLLDASKDSHAIDTRVLALATLGRLTEKTDSVEHTPMRADFSVTEEGNIVNKYWLSYEDRFNLARYVADLYEPLQNTALYGMKDYGLNAEEMVSLSNELVGIYMQFLPLEAPTVTLGRCGRVEKMDTENRRILSAEELKHTKQGAVQDAECPQLYTHGGVFVFGGRSGTVEMTALNFRNRRKYEQEAANKGMELFGEALMWVFGGALIGGAFRGLRLLAGVSKSLPRAIRSGKLVYKATKGSRVYRWTSAAKRAKASIKVGSKYMSNFNFKNYLAQNGMAYEVTKDAAASSALIKTTTAVSRGAAPRIPAPTTHITVTAADASSGLARKTTFGVNPRIAQWSVPVQRAQLLRFAQQRGLRNVWSAADRRLFLDNIWFKAFEDKNITSLQPDRIFEMGYGTEFDPLSGRFINGPITKEILIPKTPMTGSLLAAHPVLSAGMKAYGKTLRFFGLWKVGDMATGLPIFNGVSVRDVFNRWMKSEQEESLQSEMKKYGNSLSPKAMAELKAQSSGEPEFQPGDVLTRVGGKMKEPFGWMNALTFPSYLWQKIAPAQPDETDGSLIIMPAMVSRAFLSELGHAADPFITGAVKQRLAINAHSMDLGLARIARMKNLLNSDSEQMQQDLTSKRREAMESFDFLKSQYPAVDWSAEEHKFEVVFADYEKDLKDAKAIVNVLERSKQMNAAAKRYAARMELLSTKLNDKYQALSFDKELQQNIDDCELFRERDLATLREDGLDKTHPELYNRSKEMYDDILDKLKGIRADVSSVEIKTEQAIRYMYSFAQTRKFFWQEVELQLLEREKGRAVSPEDKSELYPSESAEVPSLVY